MYKRQAVGDGQSGQLVVVEITAFAKPGRNAQGRVIEILGQTGSSKADRMAIIRHYGLKDAFDPAALQEAERRAVPVQKKDLRGRTDFREQTIVTIDGADAKDFDDAIALEETPEGGYTLCVHIADVTQDVYKRQTLCPLLRRLPLPRREPGGAMKQCSKQA